MYAEHIPGVYNTVADVESRQSFELNDWKIHKGVFIQLQKVLDPSEQTFLQHGTTNSSIVTSDLIQKWRQ